MRGRRIPQKPDSYADAETPFQDGGIDRFTMPYAKPPTGPNRFADPVPLDRFDAR